MNARLGRLFISRIDDSFDPTIDVAYGPWCFLGRENDVANWENLFLFEAFQGQKEITGNARLLHQLALDIVDKRGAELNSQYGLNFSREFWHYMLFYWIYTLADAAWYKWRVAEKVIAHVGERPLTVPVDDVRQNWCLEDTRAFALALSQSREFDTWLSSVIIRAVAPPSWTLETRAHSGVVGALEEAGIGLFKTSPLRRLVRRFFPYLRCQRVLGMGAWGLLFSLYMALLPRRQGRRVSVVEADPSIREKFPAGFVKALDFLLEVTYPTVFSRDFKGLIDRVAASAQSKPGALRVGYIDFSNEPEKLVTALAMEGGERFVAAQHGAGYGITQHLALQFNHEYAIHGLQTWGWTHHGEVPVRAYPLPSPFLSRIRNRHREQDQRIILVSSLVRLEYGSVWNPPMPVHALTYRRQRADFLLALPPEVRVQVTYRPYKRAHAEAEDEEYLHRAIPGLSVLEGDLHQALLQARMAIVDHPGTTMQITLAANVPTICYWDPDVWTATPQADAVFEHLRRAGIVHHDPAAAAAKVEAVWGDVQGWWQSREVQDARRLFCHHYARSSPVWWWHWLTGLARMAADRPNSN